MKRLDVFMSVGLMVVFLLCVLFIKQHAPVAVEAKFPMQPPKVEVVSDWSSGEYFEENFRYIKIDGRLVVETSISTSRGIAFVPTESATSVK